MALAAQQAVPPFQGYENLVAFYLPVVPDQASLVLQDSWLLGLHLHD